MTTKRVRFTKEVDDHKPLNGNPVKKQKIDVLDEKICNYQNRNNEKKHTLDSDEEDETENYIKYDAERFEGQEEATVEYDGKTKIMAFNMKEDMEEGHFDESGTFIFNKKENVIKDAWLDNINWENVKNSAGEMWHKETDDEQDEIDKTTLINVREVYERLLELLSNKKESVAAALKRLNLEKGLTAAEERKQRWAAKKAGKLYEADNSKKVSELTSLADSLISLGHMNAYQLNSLKIISLLDELNETSPIENKPSTSTDPFDMFSDTPATKENILKPPNLTTKSEENCDATVAWEYKLKLENGDYENNVHGPITTNEINKLQEDNYFKCGAQVRRVGTDVFYDIRRIDFDLYQ